MKKLMALMLGMALLSGGGVRIDHRGKQHDAVDGNVAVGQITGKSGRARGAVALATDK